LCYIESVKKSKEIYEHLANVYLGSFRKKNKNQTYSKLSLNNLVKLGIAVVVGVVIVLVAVVYSREKPALKGQQVLILEDATTMIDYDFDKASKKLASFDLKDMNLLGFKTLDFRIRKSNYKDNLHLSVEFISDFAERSQVYVKQIPTKWQSFKIDLDEFKDITDWSRMRQLLFVLEQWNVQAKKGTIYIDNICFLK